MVEISSTGGATSETSFYGALETLLNAIGRGLKPRVIANGQLRSQGAGHPDFGLYTQTQCRSGAPMPNQGEVPKRGVVEVKGLADPERRGAKAEIPVCPCCGGPMRIIERLPGPASRRYPARKPDGW